MDEFGHKVVLFNKTLPVVVQWPDRRLL